jgi:hypothetical protein
VAGVIVLARAAIRVGEQSYRVAEDVLQYVPAPGDVLARLRRFEPRQDRMRNGIPTKD